MVTDAIEAEAAAARALPGPENDGIFDGADTPISEGALDGTTASAVWIVRALLLGAVLVLSLAHHRELRAVLWLSSLLGVATLGWAQTLHAPHRTIRLPALAIEGGLGAVAVLFTGGSGSPLLPYLLVPAFAGGFAAPQRGTSRRRMSYALTIPVLAGAVLGFGRLLVRADSDPATYAAQVSLWVLLAVGAALIAAWVSLLHSRAAGSQSGSYALAYRLLAQLRPVARKLSSGLSVTGLAEELLRDLTRTTHDCRAAIYTVTPDGQLRWLSGEVAGPAWEREVSGNGPCAQAWRTQQPVTRDRAGVTTLVLPLGASGRGFGLARLEIPTSSAAAALRTASTVVGDAGLRLGCALLFEEVREFATAEERRRIAREIHDGVAQELAALGYRVDDLLDQGGLRPHGRAADSATGVALLELRGALTRVIDDLRLSIFELRSEVDQYGGLSGALSDFVRRVSAGSNLTVHLQLHQSPSRLATDVEAELLRIAQEAVNNARKHAQARNLWVTCEVDAPQAVLTVADDGRGVTASGGAGFGLAIMQERASRVGAVLSITAREPEGTRVDVRIGAGATLANAGRAQTLPSPESPRGS